MRRWDGWSRCGAGLLAAALLALAPPALAQPQPGGVQSLAKGKKGPISIQSDSLELRDKDKTATFINNVRLVQDDTTVECKVLVVYYDEDPAAAKGSAGGRSAGPRLAQSGEQQISRLVAKGGVVLTQKDQTATGDHGVYDVKSNTFTLIGDVVLTQGQNVVRGDRLWVDLNTNVSRVESKKTGPTRVQGLFLPNAADTKRPAAGGAHNASPEKDRSRPSSSRPLRLN